MKLNTLAAIATVLAPLLLTACGAQRPETLLSAAKESLAKNDAKVAIIQIKNALQANPNLAEARYLLGAALLDTGNVAAAELELRKAQSLNFSPDLVIPKLAASLLAQGKPKKLLEEFSAVRLGAPASVADLQTSFFLVRGDSGWKLRPGSYRRYLKAWERRRLATQS